MSDAALLLVLGAAAGAGIASLIAHRRPSRRAAPEPQQPRRRQPARRAEEALERISEGVVVLDTSLHVELANGAARALLGLSRRSQPNRLPSEDVLALARSALAGGEAEQGIVGLWFPARRHLRVHAAPLPDGSGVVVALRDATEELRTLQVRREFVTNASHELKSPVASLQALADALREAAADDPEAVARFAERMSAEAERLGRLVADLLDLSRLEEAGRTAEEPVDLAETLGAVADAVRLDADAKLIDLRVRLQPGVIVTGDAEQLAALARNLLDNALRYTPDGGWVELEVTGNGSEAIVRVTDSGIGIPTEAKERIFERFYRVDSARARASGGTGLGLAIVKHVTELHGGRVEVDSEVGRGSTFTVRLPAAAARAGAQAAG